MKQIIFISLTIFLVAGCSSSESSSDTESENVTQKNEAVDTTQKAEKKEIEAGPISQLEIGMNEEEVINIMGEPTSVSTLSSNNKNTVEDWFYGENQKVRMIKGEVNHIVPDVEKEQKLIIQLLKAREEGDKEKAKEIMQELKNN